MSKVKNEVISIIVPVYNVEKYIKRCVESLVNQTYKNIEIILVDDGSKDNCSKICDYYAIKDKRIKVIHKTNGGLSDARNAGFCVATGKLIMFIDSDDYVDIHMVSHMYDRMERENSDIVVCGVNWVNEDGVLLKKDTVESDETFDTIQGLKQVIADGKIKQHVWNKLYKREIVEGTKFEKGKYHEDIFWSYQIFGKANKVAVMSEAYYYYVQRINSIMGEGYSKKRLDALDANRCKCEYMKKYYPQLLDTAVYVYMGNCMYQMQCAIKSNVDKEIVFNIKARLKYQKEGKPFKYIHGKQAIWMHLFLIFPITTCKIRNKLLIGV